MLARHTSMLTALCIATVIGPASAAMACHEERDQLKHEFSRREDQLKYAYHMERDALLCAHKADLEDLRHARRQAAADLCGPEKTAALRVIDHRRRSLINSHACQMRALKSHYRADRDALDAEYHLAQETLRCTCRAPQRIVAGPSLPHMIHGAPTVIRSYVPATAARVPGIYGPAYEMPRRNGIPLMSVTDRHGRTTDFPVAVATLLRMYLH